MILTYLPEKTIIPTGRKYQVRVKAYLEELKVFVLPPSVLYWMSPGVL